MYLLTTYNYYIWAEFVCAEFVRDNYVPSLLWAEFVMCRVDLTPTQILDDCYFHVQFGISQESYTDSEHYGLGMHDENLHLYQT